MEDKCLCGAEIEEGEYDMCRRCRALLNSVVMPSGNMLKPEWMWRLTMRLLPANIQN